MVAMIPNPTAYNRRIIIRLGIMLALFTVFCVSLSVSDDPGQARPEVASHSFQYGEEAPDTEPEIISVSTSSGPTIRIKSGKNWRTVSAKCADGVCVPASYKRSPVRQIW